MPEIQRCQILDGELLYRGQTVEIMEPKPMPSQIRTMAKELAIVTGQDIFQFIGYSTSQKLSQSTGALTLNFSNVKSREIVRLIFNVDVRRKRSGQQGKRGKQLPQGRFSPPPNGTFVKFWASLNLPEPRKNSEYKNKLGLLKKYFFSGDVEKCNYGLRFAHKKLYLAQANRKLISMPVARLDNASEAIKARQGAANKYCQANGPKPLATKVTGNLECVDDIPRVKNSEERETYEETLNSIGNSHYSDIKKPPEDQTNEEWLDDYNGTSNFKVENNR